MSGPIAHIGMCIGCDRPGRLHDEVCEGCLTRRGRKWAEMSNRCRKDPEFALSVYDRIATDRGRELFLATYGNASLRGHGSTIGPERAKAARSRVWEWQAELTMPPPQ